MSRFPSIKIYLEGVGSFDFGRIQLNRHHLRGLKTSYEKERQSPGFLRINFRVTLRRIVRNEPLKQDQ